jgi:hypothetical protein
MRHRHHRSRSYCNDALESFTPPEALQCETAPPMQFPQHGDLDHFRRLARMQGIEAAANAYSKEEISKLMRVNGFTYLNPRARKIDLAHALAGML